MIKIAVASGKGGTGKTLLSGSLSIYLKQHYNVILTDLDVEEPNSSFFFKGIESGITDSFKKIPKWKQDTCILCGECSKNCNFNAVIRLGPDIFVFKELCHSCYACSELCPTDSLPMIEHKIGEIRHIKNENQILVEGKLNIGEEQAVPLIQQTKKYVVNNFPTADFQIIDCPPGNSCPVVAAVEDADYVILITEPTPFGLNDLRIAVETMQKLNKKTGVIINRDGIGDNKVQEYCNENKIIVLGKIKYDRKIAVNYAKGELINNNIDHFTQSINDIAESLMKEMQL